MQRGRPVKSEIRQNIIEILAVAGKAYGYLIHKWYNQIFPQCTRENVYYNLRKGVVLGELKIDEIKQEKGIIPGEQLLRKSTMPSAQMQSQKEKQE